MAQSFECVECKHVFDKPRDPLLTIGSFILFVVAIGFLFGFFPVSIGLFLLIWWMNQSHCPKCRSKRIVAITKAVAHIESKEPTRVRQPHKKGWTGLQKFIVGIVVFTAASLGLLAILAANAPKPPTITQEQIDAMDNLVTSISFYKDSEGTPQVKLSFKNTFDKTIDAIDVRFYPQNAAGEYLEFTKFGGDEPMPYVFWSQQTITPGKTETDDSNFLLYPTATQAKNVEVIRVHFSDGTEITRQ